MTPLIRQANPADVPILVEIEQASFSHPSWTGRDFMANECQIAEVDSQIAGFLVSRQVFPGDAQTPPEREILNLAVAPSFRRIGIASALLQHQLTQKAIYFLEVRESNVAAQALYRRFGFIEIGRRPSYYRSPVETALVMRLKWC